MSAHDERVADRSGRVRSRVRSWAPGFGFALVPGIAIFAAMLVSGACTPTTATDGGGQAVSVPDDASTSADAHVDATTPVRRPCPVVDGEACRALDTGDVATIVTDVLAMPGVTFAGDSLLAYAADYTRGAIVGARTNDLRAFEPASPVSEGTSDVTGAHGAAGNNVYVVARRGSGVGLFRAPVRADGTLEARTEIATEIGVAPYWPQATGLHDGRVLLAYVASQDRAFLTVSADGAAPFAPRAAPPVASTGPRRGILAHVGETRGGAWVFTHQLADEAWRFTSFVHLSRDEGTTWSDPIVVAPDADDVHDTFPITRTDGGADLYYLHVGTAGVFGAFRRALHEDGTLGPEQAVTAPTIGHVEKPQARRLPDGRIALLFAARTGTTTYAIRFAVLEGDAPL